MRDFKFRDLIILFISLGVFITPFIVDYSALPKGFELPKVFLWQAISIPLIVVSFSYFVYKSIVNRKINITMDMVFYLVIIALFFFSTIASPFQEVAWVGNDFRFQGFITHFLIVTLCYLVFKTISIKNYHFLAIGFVLSSLFQAGIGIYQFFTVIKADPALYFDGFWVNGTFGQTNWFTGRLLIGIIFCGFYLGYRNRNLPKGLNISKFIIVGITATLSISAIIFSRSIWAIITLPILLLLVIVYQLITSKVYLYFFRIFCVAGVVISTILFLSYKEYNLRVEIWKSILEIMLQQSYTPLKTIRILLGYGFDTLGLVFQQFHKFPAGIIDRAHNFIFDILIQNGFVIFLPLIYLIKFINSKLKDGLKSREFTFFLIALIVWSFRSIIHESGIVNMVDFLIILGATLGLARLKLD